MFHGRTTEDVYQEYLSRGGKPMPKVWFVRGVLKAYPELEITVIKVNGKSAKAFRRKGEKIRTTEFVDEVKAIFG